MHRSPTHRSVVLSGIQPSGHLTLGNYLGAIKSWLPLSEAHDCYYMLVDLHAITVWQEPAALRERCYEFLSLYLACGLDPSRNVLFVQSHVAAHPRLAWILNCHTQLGELNRMTQFKDKSDRHSTNVNAGLYDYPVLMAADILLYQADHVPVGDDQKQHLELTRDIALRFNRRYGPVFAIPEPMIPPVGSRIMGLQTPTAKMSKSDHAATNAIYLLDPPDTVVRKVRRAVTDSESKVRAAEGKPGVSNLMTILSACTGESLTSIEGRFTAGYGPFKKAVADAVVACLEPIQARYADVRSDTDGLRRILREGAELASAKADATLTEVHEVLGFIPR